ncbi:MAG: sugar ABC transporter permease, partial [Clostridiales bacterium]|nr:sugar ABC transporter permease [Clostridiales bacterium]
MERNTMSYKTKQFLMFAGPALILFSMVIIIPFVYGLYLTFTSWDGVSVSKPFVGFANYISAFKDYYYWAAIGRTLIYSAFAVILINVVAFLLAYLVTSGVKGQNFFRAGFFIPNLIGGIVLGYVWKFVFNRAFVALGEAIAAGTVPSLLSTPSGALFCLVLVSVWQYAGYMMLIYVAGFMGVSDSLKEAAMIDGCTPSQAMW